MSLIEVLISMFVLLFGLMGVAAIFPVGNYYVVEGEKFDLASGIAQNAFEELRARGMLKPKFWLYGHSVSGTLQPTILPNGQFVNPVPVPADAGIGPGHAFIIDPLGVASDITLSHLDVFPRALDSGGNVLRDNPWEPKLAGSNFVLSGTRWPVRRLTLPQAGGFPSTSEVAETIFRLRDDLAVDQPDESDLPSVQLWDIDAQGTAVATDDVLLRRQYKGDYSWLATIVPTTGEGLAALQPAESSYGAISCDVSIVVFRKREETPSAASERLIQVELLQGGELVIFSTRTNAIDAKQEVDDALDDIRAGNWISLMGVNQTTGDFVMKWYRILSIGNKEDTGDINVPSLGNGLNAIGRRAMLIGPDWPETPNGTGGVLPYIADLRAGIFPGVISVVTKPLRMESSSLWDLE